MGAKEKHQAAESAVPLVKACGFASYSPEVLVVFGAYSSSPTTDRVFSFPPPDGKPFSLPKQTEEHHNFVLLVAPERLAELQPSASRIYRLLIFGTTKQLEALKVPVVDTVLKEGRIDEMLRQTVQSLREKITTQAVDLPLCVPPRKKKKVKPEAAETEPSESVSPRQVVTATSLLGRLRRIQGQFKGTKLEFEDAVMIPTILRLVREIKRSEFRQTCEAMAKHAVPEVLASKFRAYVEEQTASGKTLGRAARTFLWPKKSAERKPMAALVEECECPEMDLKLVVVSVQRLQANLT